MSENTADVVARHIQCVFAPDDLVEIRRLPSGRSTWHKASELPAMADALARDNATEHIYIGANPRTRSGGKDAESVALARTVFVDFDKCSLDEARFRLGETDLPAPTITLESGGGVHVYWRLDEPLTDLARWTRIQRGLAERLDADRTVHDTPRIMRLPGFVNHKYSPARPCRVVEADAARTYCVDEFPVGEAHAPAVNHPGTDKLTVGQRNDAMFTLAASMRAKGLSPAAIKAALLEENQARCDPPLDLDEIGHIAVSAGKYTVDKARAIAYTRTGEKTNDVPAPWVPFPVDVLPEPIGAYVAEGASAIGCDVAMIALPTLANIAATIGTTRQIRLKASWTEPCVLWCVVVCESGTLKSPGHDYALRPLRRWQSARLREADEGAARYRVDRLQYEADLGAWKRSKAANRGDPPEEPEEPTCERLIVADCTVESLAPLLLENCRGLLLARDELAGWIMGFNQYRNGKGGDLAAWLEFHRAGTVTIDRKTGIRRIHIPRAAVSVCGTVTPGVLRRALTCEYRDAGLLARLLLAAPPTKPKRWTEADISARTGERFAAVLDGLLDLRHGTDGDGGPVPVDIPLSPDGKRAWVAWYDAHATRQASASGELAAAFSKLEGYAARFALVVQLTRWAAGGGVSGGAVDAESVDAGAKLAEWFSHEAERVYGLWAESDEQRIDRELVELVRRKGAVTPRDVLRASRLFDTATAAETSLNRLAQAGIGCWVHDDHDGGRGQPTRRFRITKGVDADANAVFPEKNIITVNVNTGSQATTHTLNVPDSDVPELVYDETTGEVVSIREGIEL